METAVPQTPPPGGDGPNEPVAAAMEAAIAAAGPAPTLTQPDPADWIATRT